MPAPQVHLDLAEAAELAEMLTFLSEWLARFTFLLGHDDGERVFGTGEN